MAKKTKKKKTTKKTTKTAYTPAERKKDLSKLQTTYVQDVAKLKDHAALAKKQVDKEMGLLKKKIDADYKKAKKTFQQAKQKAHVQKEKTRTTIKKHPFLSVAAGAVGGAILAKVILRKKKKR